MAIEHWLTLTLTAGVGPILARRLIERAGSIEAACAANAALLRTVEGIGMGKASKIAQALIEARAKVDDEMARVTSLPNCSLLCAEDDAYPQLLRSVSDAPLVLYVRGTVEPRDLNAMAIVGSRKCSLYGREQAERFAALLASAGFTVISGGARGVDSAAHRGAMQPTRGRTIAVLGSGLDVPYPPENVHLFEQIAERGAVMSEFPFGTPPIAENFPRRNRIVSGMSRGVLVIEADERSGALITARQAIEDHSRPVMAIPGRCDNPQSAGPHKLIREGATLVTRLEHILEALGPLDASLPEMSLFDDGLSSSVTIDEPKPSSPVIESKLPLLEVTQAEVFRHLTGEPLDVDALIDLTGFDSGIVLRELTFLSLKGLARRIEGRGFIRAARK